MTDYLFVADDLSGMRGATVPEGMDPPEVPAGFTLVHVDAGTMTAALEALAAADADVILATNANLPAEDFDAIVKSAKAARDAVGKLRSVKKEAVR